MFPRQLLMLAAAITGATFIAASTVCAAPAKTTTVAPGVSYKQSGQQHHSSGKGNKGKQDSREETETQHTTIALVTGNTITIQTGKDSKEYKITQDTQIEIKGVRAAA